MRLDSVDYSVDPRMQGRLIDSHATPTMVTVTCDAQVVAAHERCWADQVTITDPAHLGIAPGIPGRQDAVARG